MRTGRIFFSKNSTPSRSGGVSCGEAPKARRTRTAASRFMVVLGYPQAELAGDRRGTILHRGADFRRGLGLADDDERRHADRRGDADPGIPDEGGDVADPVGEIALPLVDRVAPDAEEIG